MRHRLQLSATDSARLMPFATMLKSVRRTVVPVCRRLRQEASLRPWAMAAAAVVLIGSYSAGFYALPTAQCEPLQSSRSYRTDQFRQGRAFASSGHAAEPASGSLNENKDARQRESTTAEANELARKTAKKNDNGQKTRRLATRNHLEPDDADCNTRFCR